VTIAEVTASSGVVLGIAVVLLFQQLGFLALSNLWIALIAFVVGMVVGALVFGIVGLLVEQNR
jgi:ABC-type Fe3+ transport system permease subunit